MLILLALFFEKTMLGKAMRAVAENHVASALLGIPVERTIAFTFLLAGLLAGLSACSTVGSSPGASSDKEARYMKPSDPLACPAQVAWTSARASHCAPRGVGATAVTAS